MNDKITRCNLCKKKLLNEIAQYKCKCEKIFCITHKASFDHNCSFDYKLYERNKLSKNNPVIIAQKLNKI